MQSPPFFSLLPLLLLPSLATACGEAPESSENADKADWTDFWNPWSDDEERAGLGAACGAGEPVCDSDESLVCVKLWPLITTHSLCEPETAEAALQRLVASKAEETRSSIPASCIGCDLRGVDLSGARLAGAQLISADLRDAVLVDVDFRATNLSGADLSEATLLSVDCNQDTVLPQDWFCDSDNHVAND